MTIRRLRESDLPDLMALKESAGWNQTESDWRLALQWEPEGCFGIEVDDRIVATSAAACYGDDLAWIGMVLTLPEHRGKGYARQLMNVAVDYARSRCRVIKLDASDMGKSLYESMGFVSECLTERWLRPADAATMSEPHGIEPVRWDPAADTQIFGADRNRLLELFMQDSDAASVDGAYAFARPGSRGAYFGPCVSESPDAARKLMAWFVSRHPGQALLTDLFPHHEHAVAVASEFGFTMVRRLTRMVLKPVEPALPDPRIYATGSFSWG